MATHLTEGNSPSFKQAPTPPNRKTSKGSEQRAHRKQLVRTHGDLHNCIQTKLCEMPRATRPLSHKPEAHQDPGLAGSSHAARGTADRGTNPTEGNAFHPFGLAIPLGGTYILDLGPHVQNNTGLGLSPMS